MTMPGPISRILANGRVTLPAGLRRKRGWAPGQVFEVLKTQDGIFLKPTRRFEPPEIGAAFGMLHSPERAPVSVEQMRVTIDNQFRKNGSESSS